MSLEFQFCSFIENKASSVGMSFNGGNLSTLSHNNVIGNECDYDGIISNFDYVLIITNTIFSQNSNILLYNSENTSYEDSKIILSNCIIDHHHETISGNVVFSLNNSNPFVSTMAFSYYSTYFCPFCSNNGTNP